MRTQRVKRKDGKEVYKKSNETLKEIIWFSACLILVIVIVLIPYAFE